MIFKNFLSVAGEMVQWLKEFAALQKTWVQFVAPTIAHRHMFALSRLPTGNEGYTSHCLQSTTSIVGSKDFLFCSF